MKLKTCKECWAQYLDVDWIKNRQQGYCTSTHKKYIAHLEREARLLAEKEESANPEKVEERKNLNLPWD